MVVEAQEDAGSWRKAEEFHWLEVSRRLLGMWEQI